MTSWPGQPSAPPRIKGTRDAAIIAEFMSGNYSVWDIAKRYGLSKRQVWTILGEDYGQLLVERIQEKNNSSINIRSAREVTIEAREKGRLASIAGVCEALAQFDREHDDIEIGDLVDIMETAAKLMFPNIRVRVEFERIQAISPA